VAGYENELTELVAQLNRAAPGGKPDVRTADARSVDPGLGAPADPSSLDAVLTLAARAGASDLLVIAGVPVTLRVNGSLAHSVGAPLTAENTRNLLLPLMTATQQQELQRNKSVDLCFSREGIGRFRANVHYQRGTLAGTVRLLPDRMPTLESLHLPSSLRRLAEARQGLVLVTGPTGCGKSSTLAALVDLINNQRHDHVVTIEDPIEFVHTNRKSIVEQIEVGVDAPDFAGSLRSILRQNPDVILVGEMRDPETIATVHTNDASQAVSRILDSFPLGNQPQIRQQLSLALLAVVAQQLVPSLNSGHGMPARYPVVEILMASSGVRNLIRRGEDHQIYSSISTGRQDGMISMEQSLAEMVRSGKIHRDVALSHCFRSEDLLRYLQSS
jgi:twitching motility protein PilT